VASLRPLTVLATALLLAACADRRLVLADTAVTVDSAGTRLTPPGGLRAVGPTYELELALEQGPAGAERAREALHAAVVYPDGHQQPMSCGGLLSGGNKASVVCRLHYQDAVPVAVTAIALRATTPVAIRRALWWSGDTRSRCVMCI
jgi:hypothetical protein